MTPVLLRVVNAALAAAMAAAAHATPAASDPAGFPALERPALQLRTPERAVLQSAALAGSRIVAVGERGVVVLSDDAGRRWRQAAQVPVAVTLTAVRFVDAMRGWAVGHGGVILHSADGGEHWTLQADGRVLARAALQAAQALAAAAPGDAAAARQLRLAQQLVADGPDKPLLDLSFIDARTGFVVGAYNLVFETRDGGRSWSSAMHRLDNPKALHLHSIRARGPMLVVAGEQGQLHRSDDGGRSFTALSSPYPGSWFSLAIEADDTLVVAGLRGNAFRSVDRGRSWTRLEGAPSVSIVHVSSRADGTLLLLNQAGEVLAGRGASRLAPSQLPPLAQPTQLLSLPDGALLAVGFTGAQRLAAAGRRAGTER